MQRQNQESHYEITTGLPGKKVELSQQIISQLKHLDFKYKNRLTFFGGHPVSMTRNSCNAIFNKESLKMTKTGHQSPYLVCEKTDGVRYILIITRYGQFMISREGQSSVCAYEVKTDISTSWPQFFNQSNTYNSFNYMEVVEILDGELIIDNEEDTKNKRFRFLIFDILVHFGKQITRKPLKQRIQYLNKFMHANQFQKQISGNLQNQKGLISCKVKDFFRLSIPKFNVTEFLLKKYIKCLPHQNDGLIYNNQNSEYVFGKNEGYIKWKPPHLNTLDFFVVPNTNFIPNYGKKVIDLYLGKRDDESGSYTRVFYNFTIVSEQVFCDIQKLTEQKKQEKLQRQQKAQGQDNQKINYFLGVIAECSYKDTQSQQKDIFKQILSVQQSAQEIQQMIMKKNYDEYQISVIKQLQKTIYMKCWQIYKIRYDKDMPNDQNVAKRVEESIKDNINDAQLIKRNKELLTSQNK